MMAGSWVDAMEWLSVLSKVVLKDVTEAAKKVAVMVDRWVRPSAKSLAKSREKLLADNWVEQLGLRKVFLSAGKKAGSLDVSRAENLGNQLAVK
jgi:hypothetical protein